MTWRYWRRVSRGVTVGSALVVGFLTFRPEGASQGSVLCLVVFTIVSAIVHGSD